MKKQFTNPTPIESEKKKIDYIAYDFDTAELLRDMVFKINEIIDRLNKHYSKDVRGGKFGGKII